VRGKLGRKEKRRGCLEKNLGIKRKERKGGSCFLEEKDESRGREVPEKGGRSTKAQAKKPTKKKKKRG